MKDFLTENFKWLIVGGIVLLLYAQGCFTKTPPAEPTTKTETVQVPQPIVIMPPYSPQQSGATVYPITIPQQYQPSTDIAKLTAQYEDLLKQYFSTKTYKDSIQLKDTAGNRVGVVDLTQVVSENTLKSTQPSYQLSFPHTTTTITQPYKPRNQLYFGGGFQAIPGINAISQVSAGVYFKNKKDVMIGLGGVYDFNQKKTGVNISIFSKLAFKVRP